MRRMLVILATLVASTCITAGFAQAATKDYTLSVVPKVTLLDSGATITENFTVTNNTASDATCDIYVEQIGFDIPLGTVLAGKDAGGQISTPATGKVTKLTFDLYCGGAQVASQSTVSVVR